MNLVGRAVDGAERRSIGRRCSPGRWLKFGLVALVFVVAAPPCSRFAYSRLTTLPPPVDGAFGPVKQPNDATEAFLQIDFKLPRLLPFDEPAPPGTRWLFEALAIPPLIHPPDGLAGAWDPANRPHLRCILRHINGPEVSAALSRLAELVGRPGSADQTFGRRQSTLSGLMLVRARHRRADLNDEQGACDDLVAALWVAQAFNMGESETVTEIGRHAQEFGFGSQSIQRLSAALAKLPDVEQAWARLLALWIEPLQSLIAAAYSDDGTGDGWLILSADPTPALNPLWGRARGQPWPVVQRSRVWNLASPLYRSRRQVLGKVNELESTLSRAVHLPFEAARLHLESFQNTRPRFDVLDGPALELMERWMQGSWWSFQYSQIVSSKVQRSAARTLLAINRFRAATGENPRAIAELIPDRLDSIPPDDFCGGALHYKRTLDGGFMLYACGWNAKDDAGAVPRDQNGTPIDNVHVGDVVFPAERAPTSGEPVAVPIDNDAPGGE